MDILIFILLPVLGYLAGTWAEKRHYRSIEERESRYLHLPGVTMGNVEIGETDVEKAEMVYGSVVVSTDYFKRILAGLRNIFGGTVRSYETLTDRARREALLRMKEMAAGASVIVNVRIETSAISKDVSKGVACLEAIAYGTALTLRENNEIHTSVT